MALWLQQSEGVEFALKHKQVGLWHDTGLGKTQDAIELRKRLGSGRTLIIGPVIAGEHWRRQFAKHDAANPKVAIVRAPDAPLTGCDVLFVPFSLISKYPRLAKRLRRLSFALLVIDEAHALMSLESNRTTAIYALGSDTAGLQHTAPYTLLLSATFTPNGRPNELFPHLRALRPDALGPAVSYEIFTSRYCISKFDRKGHEKIVGANKDTAPELKRRLSTVFHRARKRDYQKSMPPVVVDSWPVNLDDLVVPPALLREWEKAEALLKRDIGKATGEDALALARASPHSATQRRLTGLIKVQAMAAVLAPELEAGHKVIAFSFHHEVLDALEERFRPFGVVTLDGRTSPAKREAAVKAFREDPNTLLFNGQISAAGEVIDLTPCSLMWVFEQDWVPKTLTQAIGRANRPGQVEPLTVWLLTLGGSIDDQLARTLVRKAEDIKSLEPAS